MVTEEASNSISDDGFDDGINENGKRPLQDVKDGKKRFKTKSLYRQPTVNELNRLQETENLFNSNLFRLQVEEVLQEVKVKEKTEKKFLLWFEQFKSHLLAIPEDETEYDLSEQTLSKKLKMKSPVSKELSKTKCIFKFHKFSNIEIAGSYALGTSINSKLRVDLQITVPSETYSKNDSINYRYHKKRAAYLAFIASHLTHLETVENLTFTWLNGCETRPVIDLTPTGKLGNNLSVRIDLSCHSDAYKHHRFSPSRNNLREAWLLSSEVSDNVTDVGPPTPYYNNSILQDLNASLNNTYLKEIIGECDNLKNAIILLKIWLRQRNLRVSGFVTSLIVAYLVQNKRINNIMSSYQIVRNVWIYLKTSEWDKKGISLHKGQDTSSIEEFHMQFPVVFIDRSGYYNVCWQMTLGTYQALKRECSLAVDMLDNPKINSFIPLFMTKMEPLTQFDHILCFKSLPEVKSAVLSTCSVESQVNFGVDRLALITDNLHRLLAQGLGDRVHLILEIIEADFSWPVKKTAEMVKKESCKEKLSFGLILNPENCMNIVEKGPPANLPEAEIFRWFWGSKSELRRFQDGSITEACVWTADSIADRRTITKQILEYLMQLKYELGPSSVFHVSEQLESLSWRRAGGARSEPASADAARAFDALRAELRGLTLLPLDVSAVYGTSAVFSYTCPVPPVPRGRAVPPRARLGQTAAPQIKYLTQEGGGLRIPHYNPVANVVLELGHSGKWPGDLEAFRCLKAAFHLQLSERLHQQYSLTTQAYPTHVDVLKNNLVFRLEIAHPKEITLLRREVVNGVVKFRETDESQELMMRTVLMPRLRGALHGLYQKYSSYGPTAALLKRWLSCQLLGAAMGATAPDLLAAAVFVKAAPVTPPQCPTLAFVRVMRLLAETDWKNETLVLDFNGDMTVEEITSIEQQLSTEGRPPLCIVTSQDGPVPAPWTRANPSANVLARVLALARTTYKYLQEQLDNYNDDILGAFIPSLVGYDVLIHLHSELVPYRSERLDRAPVLRPAQDSGSATALPVVEFNIVERYLNELRSAYGEFALFFHDTYGGDVIAVLWTPNIRDTRELQIGNSNALTKSSKKGDQYKVNLDAIVEDFRIMGEGLVRNVAVNNS